RKFARDPWMPVNIMEVGTAPAEVFAYLWMAIEHRFNIMVIGETGSGKTTFLNSFVSFIPPEARICSIEDTRELNLNHENWLPSVTRSGFGMPGRDGTQYGEITMFDLLRETFRQNPDYVIVGETRGPETYVLFQGMASGHPSYATFHAGSVEALVRRLQTQPINLPASLIESLDCVCVLTHIREQSTNYRRLLRLEEIGRVKDDGHADVNTVFTWQPGKDTFVFSHKSLVMQKLSAKTGVPVDKLMKELKVRAQLMDKLFKAKVTDFKHFTDIINHYYKDPGAVLKEFGVAA
ncbi:secretion system protein E, partial [Candidatus Woesearchaeota archaeon CG11_big_fil_rev_8_21_14_0_20_57_5]